MYDLISRLSRVVVFIFRPLPRVPRLLKVLVFLLALLGLSVSWSDIKPWLDEDPVRWVLSVAVLLFVLAFVACMEYQRRLDVLANLKIKIVPQMSAAEVLRKRAPADNIFYLSLLLSLRNPTGDNEKVKFPRTLQAHATLGIFRRVTLLLERHGMSTVQAGKPLVFYDYAPELWQEIKPRDETLCHISYSCASPEGWELLVGKNIKAKLNLEFLSHPDFELGLLTEIKPPRDPAPSTASEQGPPS